MRRVAAQVFFPSDCEQSNKSLVKTLIFVLILSAASAPCSGLAQTSPWQVTGALTESKSGQSYRTIGGLAEDRMTGELYVLDHGRRVIDVLDSTGVPRFSFVHWVTDPVTGRREPGEPHALAVSPDGEIFVTDYYTRTIDVLNIRGERVGEIDVLGLIGWHDPSLRPEKLALDDAGYLYVSIAGTRSGVARCRTDGAGCELLLDAGIEGVESITGMGVSPDGRFAILDFRGAPAARVYDSRGRLLVAFGGHDIAQGDLSYPTDFLFAEDGSFWVADALRHAVKHYSASGDFIEFIGGYGSGTGNVRFPTGVRGDGVGRLVVSERVGGRIQEYHLPGAVYAVPPSAAPIAGAVGLAPQLDRVKEETTHVR